MYLSSIQVKNARHHLNMSQQELADAVGLSINPIRDYESGTKLMREDNMQKLVKLFDEGGLRFTPYNGVEEKPKEQIVTLIGREGLQRFFNGVHEHASLNGGTIVMIGIDETKFIDTITPEFSQDYLARMTEVLKKRGDLEVLSIICEGDTNFCASEYNEYRWISKDIFHDVPFYIYGDTFAIMDFEVKPGPQITLINSPAMTKAYRKQFKVLWDKAQPVNIGGQ
ncbi:MAG: helix-turn-helix transcriptional regulator [Alphaproteobacteria bacterium]|nr:helix-turn-helix transcriptional regulator [Alphaproteobacteria bacterium]